MAAAGWSPLLALQRATHATLDALSDELAELALGPAEANVLANLADGRPYTPSELAAAVGSRATTMTSVLDRLADRGLIARRPHPSDRRAVQVQLTASGRRTAATVRAAFGRVERRALAGLPAETVKALRTALETMAELADDR